MSSPTTCTCCRTAASSSRATRASPPNWKRRGYGLTIRRRGVSRGATQLAMSAVVDFPVKPEARPYLDALRARRGLRGEPDWLAATAGAGMTRFAELGFPSRKSESWRYLDLQPLEAPAAAAGRGAVAAPIAGAAMRERLAHLALPEAGRRLVLSTAALRRELSRSSTAGGRLVRPDGDGDRRAARTGAMPRSTASAG